MPDTELMDVEWLRLDAGHEPVAYNPMHDAADAAQPDDPLLEHLMHWDTDPVPTSESDGLHRDAELLGLLVAQADEDVAMDWEDVAMFFNEPPPSPAAVEPAAAAAAASPASRPCGFRPALPMREKLITWKLSGCTVGVAPAMVIDTRPEVSRELDISATAASDAPAPAEAAPPPAPPAPTAPAPAPGPFARVTGQSCFCSGRGHTCGAPVIDPIMNAPPPPRAARAQKLSDDQPEDFVVKLYQMLQGQKEVLTWDPDRSYIIIHDRQRLEASLSIYFRHNRFASFQRQLNNYGFKQKSKATAGLSMAAQQRGGSAYGHPLLVGQPPEAILRLRRPRQPTRGASATRVGPASAPVPALASRAPLQRAPASVRASAPPPAPASRAPLQRAPASVRASGPPPAPPPPAATRYEPETPEEASSRAALGALRGKLHDLVLVGRDPLVGWTASRKPKMRPDGTSNGFSYVFTDPDGEAYISLSKAAQAVSSAAQAARRFDSGASPHANGKPMPIPVQGRRVGEVSWRNFHSLAEAGRAFNIDSLALYGNLVHNPPVYGLSERFQAATSPNEPFRVFGTDDEPSVRQVGRDRSNSALIQRGSGWVRAPSPRARQFEVEVRPWVDAPSKPVRAVSPPVQDSYFQNRFDTFLGALGRKKRRGVPNHADVASDLAPFFAAVERLGRGASKLGERAAKTLRRHSAKSKKERVELLLDRVLEAFGESPSQAAHWPLNEPGGGGAPGGKEFNELVVEVNRAQIEARLEKAARENLVDDLGVPPPPSQAAELVTCAKGRAVKSNGGEVLRADAVSAEKGFDALVWSGILMACAQYFGMQASGQGVPSILEAIKLAIVPMKLCPLARAKLQTPESIAIVTRLVERARARCRVDQYTIAWEAFVDAARDAAHHGEELVLYRLLLQLGAEPATITIVSFGHPACEHCFCLFRLLGEVDCGIYSLYWY